MARSAMGFGLSAVLVALLVTMWFVFMIAEVLAKGPRKKALTGHCRRIDSMIRFFVGRW